MAVTTGDGDGRETVDKHLPEGDERPPPQRVQYVTFWQVGIDQVSSNEYDAPHGHNYHEETVAAWNKVLDGGLTQAELLRVNRWIHADSTKLRA